MCRWAENGPETVPKPATVPGPESSPQGSPPLTRKSPFCSRTSPRLHHSIAQMVVVFDWMTRAATQTPGPTSAGPVSEIAATPDYGFWDSFARADGKVWGKIGSSWILVDGSGQVSGNLAPASGWQDVAIVRTGTNDSIFRSLLFPNNWQALGGAASSLVEISAAMDTYRLRQPWGASLVERWDPYEGTWQLLFGAPSSTESIVARRHGDTDEVYALTSTTPSFVHRWRCDGGACSWSWIDQDYGSKIFGHGATLAP